MNASVAAPSPDHMLQGQPSWCASCRGSTIKILHVIVGLYVGGAENMLCKLLEQSNRERFEHCIVSLMHGGPLRARALEAGARVYELGWQRNRLSMAAAARLVRLMRGERPDVVQGWMYHGNLSATFGRLLTRQANGLIWNIRHSLHDLEGEKRLTRIMIGVGARLSKVPRAIVYNSAASARQHEILGFARSRTQVIPNGFDCEALRPLPGARERLRRDLGIAAHAVVVGMIARYHPVKDHENLIRAVGLAAKRQPVHLVLIGHGLSPENSVLTEQLDAAELGTCTSLLGERADVAELVAGLDIFALSSRSEAFPQVLGEAMACGVPCVATEVGECRHVVGDTGLIVPPRDPAALSAALARMVDLGADGRQRLGERARARVVQNFSLAEVVRRYEELYAGLADQR